MRTLLLVTGILLAYLSAPRSGTAFSVSGKVTDKNNGNPLTGVTVMLKGTKTGTVTAADGNFSIVVTNGPAVLVFTLAGYEKEEIQVRNEEKNLRVKLKARAEHLESVELTAKDKPEEEWLRAPMPARTDSYKKTVPDLQGSISGESNGRQILVNPIPGQKFKGNRGAHNPNFNTEEYDGITENRFLQAGQNPLSTFSIDVDGASYANIRRFLQMGQLPPAGAVRIEEMINYFHYDYPQPKGEDPFSINTEMADCPWSPKHKLLLIGLQGRIIPTDNLPASNLVFLVDVSGSMMEPNKLPLVQASLKLLVDQLREKDRVALVVYAGNAGEVLPSTPGSEKQKIKNAIDQLEAGGSTAGGAGIQLAYKVAKENFIRNGNNRVILCTDGDFNVGESSDAALEKLIEQERATGIYLTVLGYGMGNYKDSKMQKLADKGNGNHSYIDNFNEARKVLVNEFGGTLFTIAKDVKLQVEFNPARVEAYRLVGYENRILNKEDFNNDRKDAGDLGSGHTVTALYEIIPAGVKSEFIENVDPLKYQQPHVPVQPANGDEWLTIKFRYKKPDGDRSLLIVHPVTDRVQEFSQASENYRFASAVAEFGMLLRNSEFKQKSTFNQAWQLAKNALGKDEEGYRSEFLKCVRNAIALARKDSPAEDKEDQGSK